MARRTNRFQRRHQKREMDRMSPKEKPTEVEDPLEQSDVVSEFLMKLGGGANSNGGPSEQA